MVEKTGIDGELRVKEILKQRGMKMYELADMMGIKAESLTRALQRNPQYSTLKSIAETLDVSVKDLFKGEDSPAPNKEMRGCIFYNDEMFTFSCRKDLENFLKKN